MKPLLLSVLLLVGCTPTNTAKDAEAIAHGRAAAAIEVAAVLAQPSDAPGPTPNACEGCIDGSGWLGDGRIWTPCPVCNADGRKPKPTTTPPPRTTQAASAPTPAAQPGPTVQAEDESTSEAATPKPSGASGDSTPAESGSRVSSAATRASGGEIAGSAGPTEAAVGKAAPAATPRKIVGYRTTQRLVGYRQVCHGSYCTQEPVYQTVRTLVYEAQK